MKKAIIILAILVTILSLNKEKKVIIPKDSIRFRVIANSDQEQDQTLKKKVVTNLNKNIKDITFSSENLTSSRQNIKNSIPNFSKIVKKTLDENQSKETYKIKYGKNHFPRKEYKGIVYEEGNYESLVVTLGNGLGENFWCVLFPPLCLLEAEESETESVEYTSFIKEIVDKYF